MASAIVTVLEAAKATIAAHYALPSQTSVVNLEIRMNLGFACLSPFPYDLPGGRRKRSGTGNDMSTGHVSFRQIRLPTGLVRSNLEVRTFGLVCVRALSRLEALASDISLLTS